MIVKEEGDFNYAYSNNTMKIDCEYEVPFIAHASMETINCTAYYQKNKIEIWVSTQSPQPIQSSISSAFNVPLENVIVHTLYSGGGFGRRLHSDFPFEAVEISKEIGKPVKVIWNREDDMQNDLFRPASFHKLSGAINENSELVAWKHHVIAPSIRLQRNPGTEMKQPDAVDGALQLKYSIPNFRIEYSLYETPVQIGFWRSVYNSQNAFANESFVDEVAFVTGKDPYEFRLKLLRNDARLKNVLEKVAALSSWGEKLPERTGKGIACHFCFGTYVAYVVQVTVDKSSKIKVDKVFAAIDCGQVLNPDMMKSQVEGGIIFALSAAMKEEITVENGSIKQKNFDTYEPLRYEQTPEIEIYVDMNDEAPGGIGEPVIPCTAPALCNAIFAATGKRIRKLPVNLK